MAFKCDNCRKGVMYGHNVSHSKRRTNRVFKPNLQYTRLTVDGKSTRMRLCTNCIKLFRKRAQAAKENLSLPADTHSQTLSLS